MKKKANYLPLWYHSCKKLLVIMRLTAVILLISTLQTFAVKSYAQSTRLSLNLTNTTVKQVLSQIESQSEFYFLYNSDLIDVDRTVSVSAKNERVDQILHQLFDGENINFIIKDRHIVLTPDAETQQQIGVKGHVTDKSGGPLPGVTIVIKGTSKGTITDTNGNYEMDGVPSNATLVFSFVGMKSKEIAVESRNTIDVQMEEETIGVGEV
jgi:hypothetical protein